MKRSGNTDFTKEPFLFFLIIFLLLPGPLAARLLGFLAAYLLGFYPLAPKASKGRLELELFDKVYVKAAGLQE